MIQVKESSLNNGNSVPGKYVTALLLIAWDLTVFTLDAPKS